MPSTNVALTHINCGFNVVRGGLNITAPPKTPHTHATELIHVEADSHIVVI